MRTFENIKTTIETGLGKHPCDLRLENVNLVNVYSEEVYKTNIHIKDGRVISIDPTATLESKAVINCEGKYAIPGFIDSHMHFESTLLSPEALGEILVGQGTTTVCADLMEIANVAGGEGIEAMLTNKDVLPYRVLIEVSSRVPTAPGLETTGAILGRQEVKEILEWEDACSLGELDPSKILFVQDEYIHKIADTLNMRKIVNGHAIGRLGQELNVYASAGISDDHECVTIEEVISRLKVGISVLIREGSSERNLDELITGVLKEKLPFDNLMFCTDDKHPHDVLNEGHINYNVNRSIALGVPAMKAIQMGTINISRHFRLEDEIGSITPGRYADIILADSMEDIRPEKVFFKGVLVAEKGRLVKEPPKGNYEDWIKNTVILKNEITEDSFKIKVPGNKDSVEVHVIDLILNQIINKDIIERVTVVDGEIKSDVKGDILKLGVVERYGKNGNVGLGLVKGFTLKKGALAFSMSHDHHNIVVVGTNDLDMAAAVNEVHRIQGGLAVSEGGNIKASMTCPIGGLMSEKGAFEVMDEIEVLNEAAKELGCDLDAPFMTLSFISLPTVPELGLTDLGLIDVLGHQIIDLIVDN